jgi:hypothetical protein
VIRLARHALPAFRGLLCWSSRQEAEASSLFRENAVMPVGDACDAILRHSALGQRQKPHNPKRAREDSGLL